MNELTNDILILKLNSYSFKFGIEIEILELFGTALIGKNTFINYSGSDLIVIAIVSSLIQS